MSKTSWDNVSRSYNKNVGKKGHYFHQHTIIPQSLELLKLDDRSTVLDLACGQGVLARHLPKNIPYIGLDISKNLLNIAKQEDRSPIHEYKVQDISKPFNLNKTFTHLTCILAFQNLELPGEMIKNAANHMTRESELLIVINHPVFRIPRLTSWGIDPKSKTQFRRIDKYMTTQEIPITANPSERHSQLTWSFHHSLQDIFTFLRHNNLVVSDLREWISDKNSVGTAAKMENRSREEFPMFMALVIKRGL